MIIRPLHADCQVAQRFELQALAQGVPAEVIGEVLQTCPCCPQRERKLNLEAMVWLLIGMNLSPSLSLGLGWRRSPTACACSVPRASAGGRGRGL